MTISTLPDVSTETIGSVETTENLDGYSPEDFDRKAHYVKKRQITDGYVFGTELQALCGYRWVPSRDPQKFPICTKCKAIHDNLPKGENNDE